MSVLRRPNVAPGSEYWQRSAGVLLLDQAKMHAWQRLLFVQCGDGWLVEEAWRRLRRGYACGVDTAAKRIAHATALRGAPGDLEFKTWDGARLPCPTGFFQAAFSIVTLEWCVAAAEVLGEMHRVLEPGGDVYLLERNSSTQSVLDSVASVVALLHAAGFHEAAAITRCDVRLAGGACDAAVIIHARAAPPVVLPSSSSDRCNVA